MELRKKEHFEKLNKTIMNVLKRKYISSLILVALIIPSIVFSQTINLKRTIVPPSIDGVISAGEYPNSESRSNFIQLEPSSGTSSLVSTKIYSAYDNNFIYFGIVCYDSEPEKIVSSIQSRDKLSDSDDAIFIMLDTYNDQRSAFVFGINPIGTQTDLRIRDNGRIIDSKWDAQWLSSASITDSGWVAEFAIPFKSISYNENINEWGINFKRVYKQNFEIAYWYGPLTYDAQISQQGKLQGIELLKKNSMFVFTPYTTISVENTEETKNKSKVNTEAGGDLTINITSSLMANLTYNPDFATVEGDQERINLSRYELSYPEKRLFFMEGNELYTTRIRTFYSRRIGDIDYGAKVTGKISDYSVSSLFVRSPRTDNKTANYFSTFRIKKDILESSTIGFTFADKSWDTGFARSFGLDYLLNINDTWKFTGQFVTSAPGDFLQHSAWFMRFANESNTHHIHIRYSDIGEKFKTNVNKTGFIRDDDRREIDGEVTYKWFEKSFFQYIYVGSNNNAFWSHTGKLRGYDYDQEIKFYLKNRFSFQIENNWGYKLFEKDFYNYSTEFKLGYNTDEWESVKVAYIFGKSFDLDFKLYEFEFNYSPFKNLTLQYSLEKVEFTPDLESESTIINIINLDYNFTRDMWIKIFAQNNSNSDRIYFYGSFGWRFIPPFSALYLIYTYDDYKYGVPQIHSKNKVLFLKLSYQFNF